MKIGLHDNENDTMKKKTFPNLALMRISAYHKSLGDTVDWWQPVETYDRVYSSKVFSFTKENPLLPENAIRGGTGYKDIPLDQTLPPEIESCVPDYTIYPSCDYAIGYLTRGCPRACRWCVVPKKEGNIKAYRTWQEVVRPDSDKLTLMDNNILACTYGLEQLEELSHTKYKVDLNQGMDVRLVTPDIADLLSRVKWQRHIRFSCDTTAQISEILRVAELFKERGVKPYRLFVYLLVTDDLENACERVETLKKLKGINIYPQAERNDTLGIMPNKAQKEFVNRYMYGRCYKKETWLEYLERKGFDF
ncbi:MAG: radical SAM protein [Eubacteriales bacterium]